MRKFIGIFCVFLGVVCLLSAIGIVFYNRWEDKNAETISHMILEDLQIAIAGNTDNDENKEDVQAENVPGEMATVEVDGYECIGILEIPVLELELPVLTDWSYEKLNKAPCLYYGSYYEKDFVIAAHNYTSHFGRLSELQTEDIVIFTDVNGRSYYYEVVLLETLPEDATKEMIASGFDLSLYTCTLGGDNRITVRCSAAD